MNYLQEVSWTEIFAHWRSNESANPDWVRTATEVKGWPDWESWRMFTANQLGLPQRTWKVFTISDPLNELPSFLVGPFTGWQSRLPNPNRHTFAELLAIPEQYEYFRQHTGLRRLMEHFPHDILLTGLRMRDGRVVLIEGHHRVTAIALASKEQFPINISAPVSVALAELTSEDDGLLDRVLARGSAKQPPQPPS